MEKTKVDFITDLLSSKKLDTSHKERFFSLAVQEIKKMETNEEIIWKEIEGLKVEFEKVVKKKKKEENVIEKDTVKVINNKSQDGNKTIDIKKDEIKHDPIKTSEALALFKDGNGLKWITHIYPNTETEVFDYEKITNNAISEFNIITKDLPYSLIGIINLFLRQKITSPDERTFGFLGTQYKTWWSDEIKNWCKTNPGLHPDTDTDGLSKNIITPFKKSIEIRDGNDLITAIKYKLKTHGANILEDLEINFDGIKKSTRFFTGVDQLMTGISCLFAPIVKRKDTSNNIRISTSISEFNERYTTVITICHIGSNVEQEFNAEDEFTIERFITKGGDLLTARDKFLSLCDWNIIANYSNGTFLIPALASKKTSNVIKKDNPVDGFTHQLIFY